MYVQYTKPNRSSYLPTNQILCCNKQLLTLLFNIMEPVTKKIKISPEKPEIELWQCREDLRKKDEAIARLNECLRVKEEEISRLNECVTKLKEELKNIETRNNGMSSENSSKSVIIVKNESESSPYNERESDDSDDEEDGAAGAGGSILPGGRKCKWKRRFCLPLLQVYAKYKMDLECPNDTREVWTKISNELRAKCSTNKDGSQCMLKVEDLRKEYERLKNANSISKRKARFFQEAKHAFESDGSSVTCSPGTSDKWYKNRPLKLLELYTKYKTQLSRPNVQEHIIWKEIAGELRVKHSMECGESECRNMVDHLRSKYERIKSQPVFNEETAMFMDAARQAFETTDASVYIPDEHLLSVRKRKSGFRLRLLQVYVKYRHELSRPGVREDRVWDRIAQEVREYSFSCGSYLCRHEVSRMRDQYEFLKGDESKRLINPIDMRNLLQDARKAFED